VANLDGTCTDWADVIKRMAARTFRCGRGRIALRRTARARGSATACYHATLFRARALSITLLLLLMIGLARLNRRRLVVGCVPTLYRRLNRLCSRTVLQPLPGHAASVGMAATFVLAPRSRLTRRLSRIASPRACASPVPSSSPSLPAGAPFHSDDAGFSCFLSLPPDSTPCLSAIIGHSACCRLRFLLHLLLLFRLLNALCLLLPRPPTVLYFCAYLSFLSHARHSNLQR